MARDALLTLDEIFEIEDDGDQEAHPADALIEPSRVPGKFEVDHTVGGLQVQTRPAGIRGQKHPALGVVTEFVNQGLPLFDRDLSRQLHKGDAHLG